MALLGSSVFGLQRLDRVGPSVSRLALDPLSSLQGEVFLRNPKAEGCLGFLWFPKVRRVVVLAMLKSFALVSEDQGFACWVWPRLSSLARPGGTVQYRCP